MTGPIRSSRTRRRAPYLVAPRLSLQSTLISRVQVSMQMPTQRSRSTTITPTGLHKERRNVPIAGGAGRTLSTVPVDSAAQVDHQQVVVSKAAAVSANVAERRNIPISGNARRTLAVAFVDSVARADHQGVVVSDNAASDLEVAAVSVDVLTDTASTVEDAFDENQDTSIDSISSSSSASASQEDDAIFDEIPIATWARHIRSTSPSTDETTLLANGDYGAQNPGPPQALGSDSSVGVDSRSDIHATVFDQAPSSDDDPLAPTGIPKSDDYTLQVALQWPKQEYKLAKVRLRAMCRQDLDPKVSWKSQLRTTVDAVVEKACDAYPKFREFADQWAAYEIIETEFKAIRREYLNSVAQ